MKITYKLNCKNKYDYDTCSPYRVVLKPGKYKFDCFGGSSAKGKNDDSSLTGYGAHVSGVIKLFREKTFYIYVGGQGETELIGYESVISHGGYNGGGNGGSSAYDIYDKRYVYTGCGGGGATDIRTIGGKWNDSESIESRVIVAGAAGGWHELLIKGGNGGTTNGEDSKNLQNRIFKGGSQTQGYKKGEGQSGASKNEYAAWGCEGNSGAGGRYFGGRASQNVGEFSGAAGSGGSSFVSGYNGLPVIDNIVFSQVSMIDGGAS